MSEPFAEVRVLWTPSGIQVLRKSYDAFSFDQAFRGTPEGHCLDAEAAASVASAAIRSIDRKLRDWQRKKDPRR